MDKTRYQHRSGKSYPSSGTRRPPCTMLFMSAVSTCSKRPARLHVLCSFAISHWSPCTRQPAAQDHHQRNVQKPPSGGRATEFVHSPRKSLNIFPARAIKQPWKTPHATPHHTTHLTTHLIRVVGVGVQQWHAAVLGGLVRPPRFLHLPPHGQLVHLTPNICDPPPRDFACMNRHRSAISSVSSVSSVVGFVGFVGFVGRRFRQFRRRHARETSRGILPAVSARRYAYGISSTFQMPCAVHAWPRVLWCARQQKSKKASLQRKLNTRLEPHAFGGGRWHQLFALCFCIAFTSSPPLARLSVGGGPPTGTVCVTNKSVHQPRRGALFWTPPPPRHDPRHRSGPSAERVAASVSRTRCNVTSAIHAYIYHPGTEHYLAKLVLLLPSVSTAVVLSETQPPFPLSHVQNRQTKRHARAKQANTRQSSHRFPWRSSAP